MNDILMPYALRVMDQKEVSVFDVKRGKAARCICIGCGGSCTIQARPYPSMALRPYSTAWTTLRPEPCNPYQRRPCNQARH